MNFSELLTNRNPNVTSVKLPKSKSKVELHTTVAGVLNRIIESGDKGVSTTALLDSGLNIRQLRWCIRMLKHEGALIDSKMGKAMTRAGHVSPRVIHYVYKAWK